MALSPQTLHHLASMQDERLYAQVMLRANTNNTGQQKSARLYVKLAIKRARTSEYKRKLSELFISI